MLYSSFVSSEALAYPLVIAAVYAAIRAIAAPTRRAQVAFIALAVLATMARVQFAVLPIVFVLATVLVGARERRTKEALREQLLPLCVFVLAAGAVLASGPAHTVGVYRWLFGLHTGPLGVVHWAALDAMTLAYTAGWIIVPGALLGVWLTLARPRSTDELAFGVVAVLLVAALFFEAGLLQASLDLGKEIQERYVFYAAPLLGVFFALYASRGWPLRIPHLALAAALVLVSVRLPLSGYAVASTIDGSPILFGVYWLTAKLGKPGDASAVIAVAVGLMSLIAVLASRRPRLGTPVVLGFALLATGVASAGAVALDVQTTAALKKAYLPGDPSWVDRFDVGDVTLLQAYSGVRAITLQELFWNRSITRVVLLPGGSRFDNFRTEQARIGKDGSILVGRRPINGPLLVDTYGSTVRLRGTYTLQAGPTASLVLPKRSDKPRVAFYALGRFYDGWLADRGVMYAWPKAGERLVSGWLSMRLTAVPTIGPVTMTFQPSQTKRIRVRLAPGSARTVRIAVCTPGSAHVTYRSNVRGLIGLRVVSVQSTAPVFTPSRAACPRLVTNTLRADVAVPQRDLVAQGVRARPVLRRVEVDRQRHCHRGVLPGHTRRTRPRVGADQVVDHERRGGSVALVVGSFSR